MRRACGRKGQFDVADGMAHGSLLRPVPVHALGKLLLGQVLEVNAPALVLIGAVALCAPPCAVRRRCLRLFRGERWRGKGGADGEVRYVERACKMWRREKWGPSAVVLAGTYAAKEAADAREDAGGLRCGTELWDVLNCV